MSKCENIVICDESALHLYLHSDGLASLDAARSSVNPLEHCATSATTLTAFNTSHPLYGGEPVDVLVPDSAKRRTSEFVTCHRCSYDLPKESFFKLRPGLYITSPELTFARLGYGHSEIQLAQIGLDLCGRYYQRLGDSEILDRSNFLTTPDRLRAFLESIPTMHGSSKARRALKRVIANTGSPMETKMYLQYAMPLRYGGFGLPFQALNYDVSARRFARIAEQGEYCIDMVNIDRKVGVEYDGALYHADASSDKRRRNALTALDWQIFPVDKNVLLNPEATKKSANQIARKLRVRIQKPSCWEKRFAKLRHELGLPI